MLSLSHVIRYPLMEKVQKWRLFISSLTCWRYAATLGYAKPQSINRVITVVPSATVSFIMIVKVIFVTICLLWLAPDAELPTNPIFHFYCNEGCSESRQR